MLTISKNIIEFFSNSYNIQIVKDILNYVQVSRYDSKEVSNNKLKNNKQNQLFNQYSLILLSYLH